MESVSEICFIPLFHASKIFEDSVLLILEGSQSAAGNFSFSLVIMLTRRLINLNKILIMTINLKK